MTRPTPPPLEDEQLSLVAREIGVLALKVPHPEKPSNPGKLGHLVTLLIS